MRILVGLAVVIVFGAMFVFDTTASVRLASLQARRKLSRVDFHERSDYREARAGVPVASLRALAQNEELGPDQGEHAHVHQPRAEPAAR